MLQIESGVIIPAGCAAYVLFNSC